MATEIYTGFKLCVVSHSDDAAPDGSLFGSSRAVIVFSESYSNNEVTPRPRWGFDFIGTDLAFQEDYIDFMAAQFDSGMARMDGIASGKRFRQAMLKQLCNATFGYEALADAVGAYNSGLYGWSETDSKPAKVTGGERITLYGGDPYRVFPIRTAEQARLMVEQAMAIKGVLPSGRGANREESLWRGRPCLSPLLTLVLDKAS